MAPVLYYTPGTCALSCIVAFEWSGQAYTLSRVDRAARSSDAYKAIHPRQQVPAMSVDGQVLVEANAILGWIDASAPDAGLLPASPWERAVAGQWLASFASGFHAAFWPYFRPDRYTVDAAHQGSVKASAVAAIRREMATMDAHLAKHTFVLGDQRTLLDAYLHAMERWADNVADVAAEYPNVFRHRTAMASDRAVQFARGLEADATYSLAGTGCVRHEVFGG